MNTKDIESRLFTISSEREFNNASLEIFHYQYNTVEIYKQFVDSITDDIHSIKDFNHIPFLPIEFFKTHKVMAKGLKEERVFLSSGTTGTSQSLHFIADLSLYEKSFVKGFQFFYGSPAKYRILALLPSYLEREGSSLVFMAGKLIDLSENTDSGFFLNNYNELADLLTIKGSNDVFLLGVTYALLDLAEKYDLNLEEAVVMETGGMKGRRKEMVRGEMHEFLKNKLGVSKVHSEYGMTELLSQAYSKGDGIFRTPPWMKILIRDTNDPLSLIKNGKTGGINIIDLANVHSCSFIATQDLGKKYDDGSFEVLGRFDSSDIRGCNLMMEADFS
jgi:phenylacetate-coenzyme A ligase PaaK-like adenylate-forming protein